VLILEVETSHSDGLPDANGLPEYLAGTCWRDARIEDLTSGKFVEPHMSTQG
jgi:hypothetical protein